MIFNPEVHHRQSIRLRDFDYSATGAYFLTVCTHERESLFGGIREGVMTVNEAGRMLETQWQAMPERFPQVVMDGFVVMPNHFHGIIVINENIADGVGAIHELPLQIKSGRGEQHPCIIRVNTRLAEC